MRKAKVARTVDQDVIVMTEAIDTTRSEWYMFLALILMLVANLVFNSLTPVLAGSNECVIMTLGETDSPKLGE